MKKQDLLARLRTNTHVQYDKPQLAVKGITYPDPIKQFADATTASGGKVHTLSEGEDINDVIKRHYPTAMVIASNMPEIKIANRNPDTVADPADLNGTDVGVIRGTVAVAENGCVWIPMDMKERAVCFICEDLVIIVDKRHVVNNMHEAYRKIEMPSTGLGGFISGPSKTADIEQALVMGAQAARSALVILI